MTGWTSGRRSHASRAVTRWIVPRMSAMRTTRPIDEQVRQLLGPEALEPAPQPDVGGVRRLGLHPDESLEHVRRPTSSSVPAGLARERRAVQRTPVEAVAWCGGSGHAGNGASRASLPGAAAGNRCGHAGTIAAGGVDGSTVSSRWRSRPCADASPLPSRSSSCTGLLLWLVAAPLVSAGDPCYHGFTMPSETTGSDPDQARAVRLQPDRHQGRRRRDGQVRQRRRSSPTSSPAPTRRGARATSRSSRARRPATPSTQAGVYPYACALHRGMSGVIVVGDGTAAAAAGAGSGTTSGTTTGTTTGTAASAPTAATQATQVDGRLLLVAAFGGAVLGGLVAWAALRRSSSRAKETVSGVA